MSHKNDRNKSYKNSALASLKRELAMPRISKSAKIAERNLDTTRLSESPRTWMSGTVEKIIPKQNPGQPERADISVEEVELPSQSLLIENTLIDENGDEVRLKKGTRVDIMVTDETKRRRTS
jgi:hypothetical protein